MKGHIFNLLEQFIVETAGREAYEEIHAKCEFEGDGIFLRPGNYPDSELIELVTKTVAHLGITAAQAHVAFGKWIFPHLSKLVPSAIVDVGHPKKLLMNLAEIHETELRKLWPDAKPPTFVCKDTGDGQMQMIYDSPRQMYDLVDGVLESVGEYYGIPISWERAFEPGDQGHQIGVYQLTFAS